ncbi:MAG: hypothetical protein EXS50_02950 [Candidatus Taylorbacteria bacterium]|nr:hypothetical protein [Candidatus Taylorbacteria bacterium]
MYVILPVVLLAGLAIWYLNKKHSKEERSRRISEIRNALRGQEFYIILKSRDGAPTIYQSALTDQIKQLSGEVYHLPEGATGIPAGDTRILIKGICWKSKNLRNMADELNFDLMQVTSDGRILGAKVFTGFERDQEALFLAIMD